MRWRWGSAAGMCAWPSAVGPWPPCPPRECKEAEGETPPSAVPLPAPPNPRPFLYSSNDPGARPTGRAAGRSQVLLSFMVSPASDES